MSRNAVAVREVEKPVQINLFESVDDQSYTNTIDLLDIAPRWVLYTDSDVRKGGKFLDSVQRTFIHNEKTYKLSLRPARIKDGDQEREEYPGPREQLVEQVVRKIATTPNRMSEKNGDLILKFSIYEVREELRRRGHTLSFDEVRESLMILHGAIVEIVREDGEGGSKVARVVSSSAFPQITLSQRGDDTETTVQFNWLVAEAIKRLQFRQLNYDIMMSFKDPIARWLFQRLSHNLLYGVYGDRDQTLTATDVQRDCGLVQWKTTRNMLARMTKAVDALKQMNVIASYEAKELLNGRKKENIVYTMTLSDWFMEQNSRAARLGVENLEDYRALTGKEPESFSERLDPARSQKLMKLIGRRPKQRELL